MLWSKWPKVCNQFIHIIPKLPTKFWIFQIVFNFPIHTDGLIEVFVGDLQYKPVIYAIDAEPINVKYISFASNDGSRVLFFYNCDDKQAAAVLDDSSPPHPLFAEPIEQDEEILAKKCKHARAWEDKYLNAIKLDSIKNSKPDGYQIQIPVFVKGVRDAHILLTKENSLSPKDGYEIGMSFGRAFLPSSFWFVEMN